MLEHTEKPTKPPRNQLKRSEKLWMGSALFFGIFALVCNLIGFATPYWIQIWPRYISIIDYFFSRDDCNLNLVLVIQHFVN